MHFTCLYLWDTTPYRIIMICHSHYATRLPLVIPMCVESVTCSYIMLEYMIPVCLVIISRTKYCRHTWPCTCQQPTLFTEYNVAKAPTDHTLCKQWNLAHLKTSQISLQPHVRYCKLTEGVSFIFLFFYFFIKSKRIISDYWNKILLCTLLKKNHCYQLGWYSKSGHSNWSKTTQTKVAWMNISMVCDRQIQTTCYSPRFMT